MILCGNFCVLKTEASVFSFIFVSYSLYRAVKMGLMFYLNLMGLYVYVFIHHIFKPFIYFTVDGLLLCSFPDSQNDGLVIFTGLFQYFT